MDDIEAMFNQLVRDIDGLSQVSRACESQEKLQTDHRPGGLRGPNLRVTPS